MRKLLILAVLSVMALTTTSQDARALGERVRAQINYGQGPVSRLVDIERRKNAAIRRIVLGR